MCDGPLIWFPVQMDEGWESAILECSRPHCGYVVISGGWNDTEHAEASLVTEGL